MEEKLIKKSILRNSGPMTLWMKKYTKLTWLKEKIVHDEPILVGFTVLNNGKQRMLEFRYDFLGRIMRPRSFRAIEMDTDSFYMALTENDLFDCFTEAAKTQMQENAKHYHEQEDCYLPNAQLNFLTRSCCKEHGQWINEHLDFSKLNGKERK